MNEPFAFTRRNFLGVSLGAAAFTAVGGRPSAAWAYGAQGSLYRRLVPEGATPAAKGIDAHWLASLRVREPAEPSFTKAADELRYIGMPVGGIGCGTLYLGGDGRLWLWDVWHKAGTGIRPRTRTTRQPNGTDAEIHNGKGVNYISPIDVWNPDPPKSETPFPFDQGFALHTLRNGAEAVHTLDHTGFEDVAFRGSYPLARVDYADAGCPLTVELLAHPIFIPLNTPDSALPATVMEYTLRNPGAEPVEATVVGWMQNPVWLDSGLPAGMVRVNEIRGGAGHGFLECRAEGSAVPPVAEDSEYTVFEDFERGTYAPWTTTGTAFGSGPVARTDIPSYQGDVKGLGSRVVNSHASAPGSTTADKDAPIGTLVSPDFTVTHGYIHFLQGGGDHAAQTRVCLLLASDDAELRVQTGNNRNAMTWRTWDVRDLQGVSVKISIEDLRAGGWGNVGVDQIVFSDNPAPPPALLDPDTAIDGGSTGIAELGDDAGRVAAAGDISGTFPWLMGRASDTGAIGRRVTLAPGATATVRFVVAWHFANLPDDLPERRREYANRFADAGAVAEYVASSYARLTGDTRRWVQTWKDSSVPYWFLDRALATASTLASANCFWFTSGRFYGTEGVNCCKGTCTHVWYYAQTLARLFPDLERGMRQNVDLNSAVSLTANGSVHFRGEYNNDWAWDGQAGVVLRSYREHLCSSDTEFLTTNWTNIRKVLDFLIGEDGDHDGVSEDRQHNTLDANWYGRVPAHISLYAAALEAGREMALTLGDAAYADTCGMLATEARARMAELFVNTPDYGEGYFIQQMHPTQAGQLGHAAGSYIDQVIGEFYARQLGLPRVTDETQCRNTLRSLWRFNYAHDLTQILSSADLLQGRAYQMPGEAGLLICTFPNDGNQWKAAWQSRYFAECMTGFEYQVAAHCLAEGLLDEGLTIVRAVYDRYHPAKRNPFNEIECSDHYARAMASYGALLAACGFEYSGPAGDMAFAPRISPADFRAPFTAAEGWGTYRQQIAAGVMKAELNLSWGTLSLQTLRLKPTGMTPKQVSVTCNGNKLPATLHLKDGFAAIMLAEPIQVSIGGSLAVELRA